MVADSLFIKNPQSKNASPPPISIFVVILVTSLTLVSKPIELALASSGIPHTLPKLRGPTDSYRCTEQASQHGFLEDPHGWANLGQGAPEVDDEIEGCFPRPESIPISVNAREYGPTAGIKTLRAAVANLYNDNYR